VLNEWTLTGRDEFRRSDSKILLLTNVLYRQCNWQCMATNW